MNNKIDAIFAMCILLFIIMTVVAIPFIFFFEKVKIKDITARKIEIIGYYILFVLVVWEFGMKNVFMGDFNNLDILIIENKLDILFAWIRKAVEGMDCSELPSEYYNARTSRLYVGYQMMFADIVELILQIASTVCIAIGRFQELRNKIENKD